MSKNQIMKNKPTLVNVSAKLVLVLFGVFFIASCAQNNIVVLEDSVKQLQNLNDYDRDGVIAARERCAETVIGATIDNYGCGTQTPKTEMLEIDIKFAKNSAVFPRSAYPEIKKLADFLHVHQELEVRIEGHTSKTGGEELNQKLSENRAKAIAVVLINDFNIAAERVSAVGYGFKRLEDDRDTAEAHAVNRRIMAKLSHINYVDDMKWTIYSVAEKL